MESYSHNQNTKQKRWLTAALLLCSKAYCNKGLPSLKGALLPALTLLAGIFFSLSVQAQTALTGTVVDEKGGSLPGVSVSIKGTANGTQTDANGRFTINANNGDVLTFTFIGYDASQATVGAQRNITVRMNPANTSLNEVVVTGYTTQKKSELTSAISSLKASEIVTTKNENLLNTLAGKLPGLRVVQNTAEPGSFANNFDIRGMGAALVVIDGVPRPGIERVDPNDIETISILKDASAAVYGVKGANGVVLITTKKGRKGSMELNYIGNVTAQVPSRMSRGVDAVDYLILANEKNVHNAGNGVRGARLYDDATIEAFRNGTRKSTDWYGATMKSRAMQQQHNLAATGGNENTNYYISLGYLVQDGLLKSEDLDYTRYNLRSNVTTKLSKRLTFDLNLAGTMDKKNQPFQSPWWIFRSMWYQPAIYSIYANDNPAYYNQLPNPLHPVAQADADASGYQTFKNYYFQSTASLTYDVPYIEGLKLKGLFNFDMVFNDNTIFKKAYNLYTYSAATNSYSGAAQESPSTIRREYYQKPSNLAQLSLNYQRSFGGGTHNVTGLLLYETLTRKADNFWAQRELTFPIDGLFAGNTNNINNGMSTSPANYATLRTASLVGQFTYDYKARYYTKFGFRQDGSSLFDTPKQWGFFPSGEIGWRLSEESFWKESKLLQPLTSFKLRASYGLTGDENASQFQFLSGYTYPASGSAIGQPGGAVFDGTYIAAVQNRGIVNKNLTWFTAKMFDAGLDLEINNGLFGFTFDYFVRNREGILATQLDALPDVVGANLPQQNLNSDRTKGFDFSVSHKNRIGEFGYNIGGTFGFTRTMNVNVVAARLGNSYLNWSQRNNNVATGANRNNNVYVGYGSAGQYQSYREIQFSPIYVNRNAVVGDYIYEDWNEDGQISVDDSHPIGTFGIPMINYGFNLAATYKGFDLAAQFQGAALVNQTYVEQLREPLWAGGNAVTQFLDRWHPEDPNADPYSPDTKWVPGFYAYTGTVPFVNTRSNLHNSAYVRLKSLDVGYTLPAKWLGKSGIKGLRIFANAYNLLTFTSLKYIDPEHPSGTSQFTANSQQYDYAYPLDKKYSFGINLKL